MVVEDRLSGSGEVRIELVVGISLRCCLGFVEEDILLSILVTSCCTSPDICFSFSPCLT